MHERRIVIEKLKESVFAVLPIGARLTASRKLSLILDISFLLGVIITVAEPAVHVLTRQVSDLYRDRI